MTNDGLTRVQKVRHAMDRFDQFVRHPLVGLGNSSERKGFIVRTVFSWVSFFVFVILSRSTNQDTQVGHIHTFILRWYGIGKSWGCSPRAPLIQFD